MYEDKNNINEFNVRIYKGDNSIALSKTDSNMLSIIEGDPRMDPNLVIVITKQFISYHMLRIISDYFHIVNADIYTLVNAYVNNLRLDLFLKDSSGKENLKLNMIGELLKINILISYYGKPIKDDNNVMKSINEEIDALVNKIFKSNK